MARRGRSTRCVRHRPLPERAGAHRGRRPRAARLPRLSRTRRAPPSARPRAPPGCTAKIDRSVGHERRYSRGPLRRLPRGGGLEPVEIRYVNPFGAVGWLVASRVLRRDQVPAGPLRAYDRLVPVLRRLDLLRLPFGLSLWAVARRVSRLAPRTRQSTRRRPPSMTISRRAFSRAAAPSRARSSGLARRRSIATRSRRGRRVDRSASSSTASSSPPTGVATTGRPYAIASRATMPYPSRRDGTQTTAARS